MDGFLEDRRKRNWRRTTWLSGLLLLLAALGAGQVIGGTAIVESLAKIGSLLFGIGVVADLSSRLRGRAAYRTAMLLAVVAVLLLGWVTVAVGIADAGNGDLDLMNGAVILVAVIGVVIARFRSGGMSRALYVTALTQVAVTAVALAPGLNAPFGWAFEIVTINGLFIVLFLGSAVLFSRSVERRYGPPLR